MRERKSIRLKNYDYSQEGAYFVTICIHDGKKVLGKIVKEKVVLNKLGNKVCELWESLPVFNENISLDQFVVMPNHLHGIIIIHENISRGVQLNAPTMGDYYSKISPKKGSLSVIIRNYKAAVTTWCRRNGYEDFKWQRNYYDRIIRSEKEYNTIREYIYYNPNKWEWGRYYP